MARLVKVLFPLKAVPSFSESACDRSKPEISKCVKVEFSTNMFDKSATASTELAGMPKVIVKPEKLQSHREHKSLVVERMKYRQC